MGTSSSRRSSNSEDAAAGAAAAGSAPSEPAEDGESESIFAGAEGSSLMQGYEELVNAIIRPPRMRYTPETDLGPDAFHHCGRRFCRADLELTNSRGLKLACSWWKFHAEDAPAPHLPCVIYLHGNASCRIGAFDLLRHLLPCAISVFALDFSGSGLSGGEHVSLGFFEREDVQAVIAHLRASGEVSTIGLWGHSMGATTALLYADRDPSIAGMVVDSAFADLMQLVNELGQGLREQGLRIPGFAISVAANMIRRSVRRRAKFDPREVSPIGNCNKCFIPALFVHGRGDAFIKPSHSQQLHDAYSGDKNLVLFDGDHNSVRPEYLFDSAVIFLRTTLGVKDEHCLDRASPTLGGDAFERGLFNSGAAQAVRQSEDEMMRQAMALSIVDARRRGSGEAPQEPGQPRQPSAVPLQALQEGIVQFRAVAGTGGATAQYYVEAALAGGGTLEDAIQLYFDSECAAPPPGWKPPAPQLLAL